MDRKILFALIVVVLLAFLPLAVSAVSVSITPDRIQPGEQMTISFSGLSDNVPVSIGISADFAVVPGGAFSFDISNLNFPFSLENGTIFAQLQNTRTNTIEVKKGDAVVKFNGDSVNGQYMKSLPFNVAPGIYDYIRLSGTSAADTISTDIRISGMKTGPDEGDITFNVGGIENGMMTVTIAVNNAEALVRTIPLESDQTQTPTQTTPTASTTGTTTSGTSSGTNGGSGNGGSAATTSTPVAVTTSIVAVTTESPGITTAPATPAVTTEETTTTVTVATPARTTAPPTTTRAGAGMLLPCTAGLAFALFLLSRR